MAQPLPLELLRCPRCAGKLAEEEGIHCEGCGRTYPRVGGIPWLFPEPELALGEWRAQLRALVGGLLVQSDKYRLALDQAQCSAATRSRLKLMSAACADHARRLKALLSPLDVASESAAAETYTALGVGSLPPQQGLTGYYANLHRDWAWGEAENESAHALIRAVLDGARPGRCLVLGAGAGRLCYDLQQWRGPGTLIAVDLNPLMLLVAQRVLRGESVQLYEFPLAPRDIESHAVLRELRAPSPATPGLQLLFADATRGPFAPWAFDTVVTPWLIDVMEEDFARFARRVNGWLATGGRWINSGSLAFQHADPARCYSLEEIRGLLAEAGFGHVQLREDRIPYLQSPASRHARVEEVVTWSAVKEREVAIPPTASALPAWLQQTDLPVPALAEFSSRVLSMRVLAFVGSLVDGHRSVRDIARVLVEERLMPADEAEAAVRGFLQRLHLESRQAWSP